MPGCIQPMSSPMMNRMLGFDCCCAEVGVTVAIVEATRASAPRQSSLLILICLSPLKCAEICRHTPPHANKFKTVVRDRMSCADKRVLRRCAQHPIGYSAIDRSQTCK